MDKEKMNNDPQNTSEEITERIEEMIEEETETGAGTVSISDRLREAEADENDYDADVEDGYDEAEYDEADGEVDGENEYGEASEDAEYVEDEYSEEEEEEDDDDEPRIVVNPKVVKVASLILFSGIILVFASIAWFTMNKEVGTGGMSITTAGMPFEISVDSPYTQTPDYSGILSAEFGYSSDVHVTGSTDSIKWLMYDETFDSTNPMRGLKPGSKGVFRFNIIPKTVGTYTIYFNPMITGYYAEFDLNSGTGVIDPESIKTNASGTYILQTLSERAAAKQTEYEELIEAGNNAEANIVLKEKQACEKAEQYLKGHLLLFEERDENGCYSVLRKINQEYSKTFTFTQEQVDNSTPIPVTIYWIWPNTFGQILLDEGDVKLHDNAMFDSTQTAIEGVTPRNELIAYICSNSGYFFESSNTSITGDGLSAYINGVVNNTSPDNLIALSNGYNNADQIIGENIQILFAEMIVSLNEN